MTATASVTQRDPARPDHAPSRETQGHGTKTPHPRRRGWVMEQTWRHLLFAHWRARAADLRGLLPPGLELDLYDGEAWLGIVPFQASARLRGLPPFPPASSFVELNVRTYVRVGDVGGVYFLSMDASRRLVVAAARALVNLPYFTATMRLDVEGRCMTLSSERRDGVARFRATYWSSAAPRAAVPGSLEHFLTERYCLFATHPMLGLYRLDIHHAPWMLRAAEAQIADNSLAAAAGVRIDTAPPLLHLSEQPSVKVWLPRSPER